MLPADLAPGLAPMLASLTREVPEGDYLYEPKWDGFRCLAFKRGGAVDLRSRNQRPLARYFPEVVEALTAATTEDLVLDGELIVDGPNGFDFPALLSRVHPAASRVARLQRETPARFVAFDLLGVGDADLRERPLLERRARLEALLARPSAALAVTPATRELALAREWFSRFRGRGVDGLIAKPIGLTYQPGRRVMWKVKHEQSVECAVAGIRMQADRPEVLGSLLLGMYDERGSLVHVGVSSSFTVARRRELFEELRPWVLHSLSGHPWERGFGIDRSPTGRLAGSAGRWDPAEMELDWIPLRPERVCEVAFDQLDGVRFRHPARFLRWRPDRDPGSCAITQLRRTGVDANEVFEGAHE